MKKPQVFRLTFESFDGRLSAIDVIADDPAVAYFRALALCPFRPVSLLYAYVV